MSFKTNNNHNTNLYPDLFIPSAPPHESEPLEETLPIIVPDAWTTLPSAPQEKQAINWDKVPVEVDPHWHQLSKVRKRAGALFTTLGVGSGATTSWAMLGLTATPLVGLSIISGLSLLTLACTIIGVSLLRMAPSENDPAYRQALRQEAGKELETMEMSYPTMMEKYENLCAKGIISASDLNKILHLDLAHLNYQQFIDKHTARVIPFLNEDNLERLKVLYLHQLHDEVSHENFAGLRSILHSQGFKQMNMPFSTVAALVIPIEAQRLYAQEGTYEMFVERNGLESIPYVTELNQNFYLRRTFLKHVAKQRLTIQESLRRFSEEIKYFSKSMETEVVIAVRQRELQGFMNASEPSYTLLRDRIGVANIKTALYLDGSIQAKLRERFLALPFAALISPDYAEDRLLLGIDTAELRNHFIKKWQAMTIQEILFSDSKTFFEAIENSLLQPREWTGKVLHDTQGYSVRQLLALSPKIFSTGILSSADILFDGQCISEKLATEIEEIATFEELADFYPEEIFHRGLLSKDSPKLCTLVANFFIRYSRQFLLHTPTQEMVRYQNLIENYCLIPSSFAPHFERAEINAQGEIQRHQKEIVAIRAYFDALIFDLHAIKIKKTEGVEHQMDLKAAEAYLLQVQSAKSRVDSTVKLLQSEVAKGDDKARQLVEQYETKRGQVAILKAKTRSYPGATTLGEKVNELESQLHQSKETERRYAREIQSQIDHDHELCELRSKMSHTKHALTSLQREEGEREREANSYTKEHKRIEGEVQSKQRRLHEFQRLSAEVESPSFQREIAQLQVKVNAEDKKRQEKATGFAAQVSLLGTYDSNHNQNKKRLQALEQKQQAFREMQHEIPALNHEIPELGRSLAAAAAHASQAREEIRKISQKRASLEKELAHGNRRIEERTHTILENPRLKKVQETIRQLEASVVQAKQRVREFREIKAELKKLEGEIPSILNEQQALQIEIGLKRESLSRALSKQEACFCRLEDAQSDVKERKAYLYKSITMIEEEYKANLAKYENKRNIALGEETAAHQRYLGEIDRQFSQELISAIK